MNEVVVIVTLYLAKVVLISILLFGYYRLFLKNRCFHQYNRYYLLGATFVAIFLPLVHVQFHLPTVMDRTAVFPGALYGIVRARWTEYSSPADRAATAWSCRSLAVGIGAVYIAATVALLCVFVRQLFRIRALPKKYPREKFGRIDLFMTREPGTPFSFFNRLFWNEEIDIDTARGRQIFLHEWFHIRERHTLDLIWLKVLLAFFWVNTIFYLIYREIRTIHEFLADRYAVADGDRYQYAELLVWHSVSDRPFSVLHPFFQSSIKRRITMLTQLHSTRPGYWRRTMVLPLVLFLFSAFALRKAALKSTAGSAPFTVVIDAGHGGSDAGAISGDTKEKDINLALALKVKQLSPEYHINVVLTRSTDELAGGKSDIRESLEYRVEMAAKNKADLLVSLHVNNAGGGQPNHGFSAFVSSDNPHLEESAKLGSALLDAVKVSYPVDANLHQLDRGIYILQHSPMPAVLLECGFIDNPGDLAFIRDGQNQSTIARNILEGIQRYQQGQGSTK
ncbi:MAG TPA: N-acetylmuramoyl-L-alanine amidase [Puia sp.]|nr:N-acetylmuramoyl-L-alanine amidase [Puia sp.]